MHFWNLKLFKFPDILSSPSLFPFSPGLTIYVDPIFSLSMSICSCPTIITSISGTKATNQRIYLVQNGVFRVQYGQTEYSTLSQAVAAISSEQYVEFSNFVTNGILIGVLSVLSSASNLSDTSKALFFNVSKFGDATGGVVNITTRGATKDWFGGVEYMGSGFKSGDKVYGLDQYGYNLLAGSVSGPILTKKDSAGNPESAMVGLTRLQMHNLIWIKESTFKFMHKQIFKQ